MANFLASVQKSSKSLSLCRDSSSNKVALIKMSNSWVISIYLNFFFSKVYWQTIISTLKNLFSKANTKIEIQPKHYGHVVITTFRYFMFVNKSDRLLWFGISFDYSIIFFRKEIKVVTNFGESLCVRIQQTAGCYAIPGLAFFDSYKDEQCIIYMIQRGIDLIYLYTAWFV